MEHKYQARIKQINNLLYELEKEKDILCIAQGEFILSMIHDEKDKETIRQTIYEDGKYYGNFSLIAKNICREHNHSISTWNMIKELIDIQNYILSYNNKLVRELNDLRTSKINQIIERYNYGATIKEIASLFKMEKSEISVIIHNHLGIVDAFGNIKRLLYMKVIGKVFEN